MNKEFTEQELFDTESTTQETTETVEGTPSTINVKGYGIARSTDTFHCHISGGGGNRRKVTVMDVCDDLFKVERIYDEITYEDGVLTNNAGNELHHVVHNEKLTLVEFDTDFDKDVIYDLDDLEREGLIIEEEEE